MTRRTTPEKPPTKAEASRRAKDSRLENLSGRILSERSAASKAKKK
jgi:hypothetical protein